MRHDPDALFSPTKKGKTIPFDFVLEELAEVDPWTRPMFGAVAVYVGEKIVFILRDGKNDEDNGVWVATTKEHHASLRRELPSLRSIQVFGAGETGWQTLPVGADDFEESVLRACSMVRAGDARIGKVPKAKKPKTGAGEIKAKKKASARGSSYRRSTRRTS